jgi:hypothetical protein
MVVLFYEGATFVKPQDSSLVVRIRKTFLNMDIRQVSENPEYLEKPDDYDNHDYNIENGFDFVIHGDISINQP